MRWIEKARNDGLSLRLTYLFMLVVSLAITAVLLYNTFHTIQSFHALSAATDAYIDLQEAADSLLKASDYLTEEAQCYTVIGNREHLDRYFEEAEITRRREHAIEVMENRLPESGALAALKNAMAQSLSLMEREYYAMRLMLEAQGDANVPAAMQDVVLSDADLALPAEEKMVLARTMMHDEGYYSQKNMIRAHLNQCIDELKTGTHGTQSNTESRMRTDLVWMTVLILIESASVILLLVVTTRLGINPLLRAVDRIKQDQELPIIGAHEFRYLAGTYNKMYTAYKRSIDHLSFKASHDELTGAYNRAGYDLIRDSINLSSTAFLLIDADHFKHINDEYGHETGDRVLKKVSEALFRHFRSDDYICRIGGDEFMVLMVHVDDDVRDLIERKVALINAELAAQEDGMPPISISVGVSMCRETADPQERFREADTALYFVKDHGRNGCCFYGPEFGMK